MKNIKQKHIDLQNDIIDGLKELKKLANEVTDVLGNPVETFENILNFPVWDYNNSDIHVEVRGDNVFWKVNLKCGQKQGKIGMHYFEADNLLVKYWIILDLLREYNSRYDRAWSNKEHHRKRMLEITEQVEKYLKNIKLLESLRDNTEEKL